MMGYTFCKKYDVVFDEKCSIIFFRKSNELYELCSSYNSRWQRYDHITFELFFSFYLLPINCTISSRWYYTQFSYQKIMQYPQKQKCKDVGIDFSIIFIYNFSMYYAIIIFREISGGKQI